MWAHKGKSQGLLAGRETVGPLVLMAITPVASILFVYANNQLGGSLAELGSQLWKNPAATLEAAFVMPTWPAIRILLAFAAFELLLMRVVPGKSFRGPTTANGNVPEYKANGFQAFIISIAAFLIGSYGLNLFSPTIVYDYYPEMIVALNAFSLLFCLMLNIKGLYFPSSTDSGTTGNWVLDYYWGTELYPRILGWDVKMFTNCRFGMMAWAIAPLSFAAANLRDNGSLSYALMANVALQLVYVAKVRTCSCYNHTHACRRAVYAHTPHAARRLRTPCFSFVALRFCSSFGGRRATWQASTSCTIALATTFAGAAWLGCLYVPHGVGCARSLFPHLLVPPLRVHARGMILHANMLAAVVCVQSVYISHSYYMVKNAPYLSPYWAALYFTLGWLCVYINYDADRQRAETRRTNGRTMIWGRPAEVIRAKYTTEQGEVKDSLLLVSGWWGVSRHFHYLPEVAAAFFWSVPGGFNHVMPYFYVIFLTILLLDRGMCALACRACPHMRTRTPVLLASARTCMHFQARAMVCAHVAAFRDDSRCAGKYGKYYKQYCERVPYKIIPGIL